MDNQQQFCPIGVGACSQPSNAAYSQWKPGISEEPTLADLTTTAPLDHREWGPATTARSVQQTVVPDISLQGQPQQLDPVEELELSTDIMAPLSEPSDLLFGTEFQWSEMPAHSWLDTQEGWDAMLCPDSPESTHPTEGDLSVDSHAVRMIPRTASVQSENLDEYVTEYGRKYHRYHQGKYLLPNDEREQDRLDLQHAAYGLLFHGNLSLAPLESPKRVLDLATGTGIWAIQFAELNPNATVIGTDLSPIQPDARPENCRFWIEDSEDPWHFERPFDYIHARLVCSCFNDCRSVIQQAYDNLEPGGWLELQDVDSIFHSDDGTLANTALEHCAALFNEGCLRLGRDVTVTQLYKQWMTEIGFEDVIERKFKMPGNTWPKDPYSKKIGKYVTANVQDALHGMSMVPLIKGLGMKEEERAALVGRARSDISNPIIHWYLKVYAVYGRKPLEQLPVPDPSANLVGVGGAF